MLKILIATAVVCSLASPLNVQAQTESSKFELLAQKDTRKGHQRMQRHSQSRHGSRRVNKPIHNRPGNGASNRHRQPTRNGANQRRQRIGNGTRENARRYIHNQRRHSARHRTNRRGQNRAHRQHRQRHWHAWRGHTVTSLPSHRHRHMYRGSPYFFFDNLWYRPHNAGFIVAAPPFGLVIPFLPSDYHEVVVRNRTYLRSNGIYYSRVDDGYTVVRAPESSLDLDSLPDMPRITVSARADQSEDQLIQDKVDCHLRAIDRSGFDPRVDGGGVPYRNYLERKHQYRQAISECLEEREYEVS